MGGCRLSLMGVVGALLGAAAGLLIGWLLWQLGFTLIGTAVMLVGAGAGAVFGFFAAASWSERRAQAREQKKGGAPPGSA